MLMLGRTLRASSLARAALRQDVVALRQNLALRRAFVAPTAARQADLVQDMYLKELKAYKPAPLKANDSEGQVQKFSVPPPPPSPEEADLHHDLQAYESETPELAGSQAAGESAPVQDWFVEEAE